MVAAEIKGFSPCAATKPSGVADRRLKPTNIRPMLDDRQPQHTRPSGTESSIVTVRTGHMPVSEDARGKSKRTSAVLHTGTSGSACGTPASGGTGRPAVVVKGANPCHRNPPRTPIPPPRGPIERRLRTGPDGNALRNRSPLRLGTNPVAGVRASCGAAAWCCHPDPGTRRCGRHRA
jgi:hypothetical protein